jgi:hypothetical protein
MKMAEGPYNRGKDIRKEQTKWAIGDNQKETGKKRREEDEEERKSGSFQGDGTSSTEKWKWEMGENGREKYWQGGGRSE